MGWSTNTQGSEVARAVTCLGRSEARNQCSRSPANRQRNLSRHLHHRNPCRRRSCSSLCTTQRRSSRCSPYRARKTSIPNLGFHRRSHHQWSARKCLSTALAEMLVVEEAVVAEGAAAAVAGATAEVEDVAEGMVQAAAAATTCNRRSEARNQCSQSPADR